MEIRFRVDQAESFRRGIDVQHPVVLLDVNPGPLPESQRELIGKYLFGTDVVYDPNHAMEEYGEAVPPGGHPPGELVEAKEPNVDSLLAALMEIEKQKDSLLRSREGF